MAAFIEATRRRSFKRVRRDPMELPEDYLIAEYRLNRQLILELCEILRPKLARSTNRGNALSVEEQVLLCLKLLASGSFQNTAKDYINVAQPTVSVVFSQFLDAVGERAKEHIYMPQDILSEKEKFHGIAGFPGVIGAIDGTHIPIIAPPVNEHLYVCRKNFHSINAQVCTIVQHHIPKITS